MHINKYACAELLIIECLYILTNLCYLVGLRGSSFEFMACICKVQSVINYAVSRQVMLSVVSISLGMGWITNVSMSIQVVALRRVGTLYLKDFLSEYFTQSRICV